MTERDPKQEAEYRENRPMRRGYLTQPGNYSPPVKPRRRWRVHFQFSGHVKTIRSFEIQARAEREVAKIQAKGGRAMIEDRWNES